MNRREFTRGLATLGLAPALPMQAMGAGGAAVASATAERLYFVSWYTARLNKTCSPQTLISELNMSPDVAREIFDRLVQTQTVSAPNAFGISRTISPLSENLAKITGSAAQEVATKPARPTIASDVHETDLRKGRQSVADEGETVTFPEEDLEDLAEDVVAKSEVVDADADVPASEDETVSVQKDVDPSA